jgi:cyclophilin family peptidyl-prolyl cis-trans isomerase
MSNTNKTIIGIVVVVVVLAGIQWYLNTRDKDVFNSYGNEFSFALPTPIPTSVATSISTSTAIEGSINNNQTKNFMNTVTIETNKGTIVFETYDADAPNTSKNFVTLANKGYYNGVIFHRVIKGFMIQGGDPTGTGRGGPGYQFADELNPNTDSAKAGYVRGTVAMANSGPNTNGSQFFIMHKDYPLPHDYTIFGKVISGMDVVDKIAESATSEDRPTTDIVMTKVTAVPK